MHTESEHGWSKSCETQNVHETAGAINHEQRSSCSLCHAHTSSNPRWCHIDRCASIVHKSNPTMQIALRVRFIPKPVFWSPTKIPCISIISPTQTVRACVHAYVRACVRACVRERERESKILFMTCNCQLAIVVLPPKTHSHKSSTHAYREGNIEVGSCKHDFAFLMKQKHVSGHTLWHQRR